MKKKLFILIFAISFLSGGCTYMTITGSLVDTNKNQSDIRTKYPYKFYISEVQSTLILINSLGMKLDKQITSSENQPLTSELRAKLVKKYPDLFTNSPQKTSIPVVYSIVCHDTSNFMSELKIAPFVLLSFFSGGLLPALADHSQCSIKVEAIVHSDSFTYQQETNNRNRINYGPFAVLGTRKYLPDHPESDTVTFDIAAFSAFILDLDVTSGCSSDFLKLFVYALKGLDHEKLQKLYNQKYHPRIDFVLP